MIESFPVTRDRLKDVIPSRSIPRGGWDYHDEWMTVYTSGTLKNSTLVVLVGGTVVR